MGAVLMARGAAFGSAGEGERGGYGDVTGVPVCGAWPCCFLVWHYALAASSRRLGARSLEEEQELLHVVCYDMTGYGGGIENF